MMVSIGTAADDDLDIGRPKNMLLGRLRYEEISQSGFLGV